MTIEKVGKIPVSAQIFIDYSKTPPQIDFGYPDPNTDIVRRSDLTVLLSLFFAGITFFILFLLYFYYVQSAIYSHISTFDTTINNITVTTFKYKNGTNYGFDSININYTWNDKPQYTKIILTRSGILFLFPVFSESNIKTDLMIMGQGFILIAVFIILFILNTLWISKVFKNTNWGNRTFPELNKKLYDAKFSAEFNPENFPEDKGKGNVIELPLFKNVYLDYEATEEFSDYLQKISIIEHPFNKLIKKGLPFSKKRKNIIKKPNVYLWKCIFEFKDRPRVGNLVLRWT